MYWVKRGDEYNIFGHAGGRETTEKAVKSVGLESPKEGQE